MKTFAKDSYQFVKKNEDWEEKQAKLFAFWAVVTATVAVISAVITLPALYTSAHNLRSEIIQESDFCRLQVRDFWVKMYSMSVSANYNDNLQWVKRESQKPAKRSKRHWLFGKWITPAGDNQFDAYNSKTAASEPQNGGYDSAPSSFSSASESISRQNEPETNSYGIQVSRDFGPLAQPPASVESYNAQPASIVFPPSIAPVAAEAKPNAQVVHNQAVFHNCPCQCQYGQPGKQGEAGDNGKEGVDGHPGAPGETGRSGEIIVTQRDLQKEPCIICPIGHVGPAGPQGSRGPPGLRGSNGFPGKNGNKGEKGMQGPPGPIGVRGPMGPQGPVGVPGRQFMREGTRGPPGKIGPVGFKGLPGCQGIIGGTVTGPKGPQGDPGRPGHDGHKGIQGVDGLPGEKGLTGDCDHCPIPRTPPGY